MQIKRISYLLLVMLLMTIGVINTVEASNMPKLKLSINDKVSSVDTLMKNNSFYVSLRDLSEAMNVKMTGTLTVLTITGTNGWMTIYADDQVAIKSDGSKVSMLSFKHEGKLMVPLREVSSYFGYNISYQSQENLLRIKDSKVTLSDAEFVTKFSAELKAMTVVVPTIPVASKGKVVYLTFDDGPTATTGQLLNVLMEHHAKATFFMIGNNVQKYPSAVKRTASEGHGLGLHGITHVKDKFYKSPAAARAEMDTDKQYIKKITGVSPRLIRTPYGSKPYFTKTFRDKMLGDGYRLWDWNVDSMDWKYKGDSTSIYNTVMNQVSRLEKEKTTPIILLHDQKETLKVLPQIIESLKKKGYSFELISPDMTPVNYWNDTR
ncbi:polysaccharide deacetylase family protein [Paenibacillus sp. FA6]|uniref:polysaccharide deacetylase n=1 Tax=Paenibacillus sp. FA6 TaxID=3413029 RepID=UPI003F657E1A